MIHQYKLNGYNIVLDVYSGSIHIPDDAAYDAIGLIDEGKTREEAEKLIGAKYRDSGITPEDVKDIFDDIEELTREVREHNNFARRMPVVEEQIKTINKRLDDLENDRK